jgi:hypothetical protein
MTHKLGRNTKRLVYAAQKIEENTSAETEEHQSNSTHPSPCNAPIQPIHYKPSNAMHLINPLKPITKC